MNQVACDVLYLIRVIQLSRSLGTCRYRDPSAGIGTGLSPDSSFLLTHGGHIGHLAVSDLAVLAEESPPSEDPQKMPQCLHWPTWVCVTLPKAIPGL